MLKIIALKDKIIRVVSGELLNQLNLDWTLPLDELKRVIEYGLNYQNDLPALKKKRYKNLIVYQGNNHLDLIDNGVGSLGLLCVADNEPQIDKDLDINNLYAERRNKDGIYFLSNLMRCSRPQGFMMFSSYNNSIESQKTKFDAAVRLLLAATGIQQSDTTGTIKEDSVLYKDATEFCEMVPFVKESKEYIYK
jgi:hypothetical protein